MLGAKLRNGVSPGRFVCKLAGRLAVRSRSGRPGRFRESLIGSHLRPASEADPQTPRCSRIKVAWTEQRNWPCLSATPAHSER
ncbi:hypothetical protein SKAU_G00318820 [Synaphobranchus kaupii]|uniref:Uncharacterized protein n=1 Tax=Synaphobranchus kaupii TaxID=118154 RepID=A0A9Q1ETC9_SYNKA|nr:hypothetical protein SKAU_G00318820 [Synaphobranchus kaupii]